ncbi:hypothetical protein [Streptomyces sp. 3211]|uniref:hypothetical protein n=1 Tax=Streptomyces sp. 3211 TaxID=1964449 RepID=UPI0009A488BA|nr:hypothetical protein [Streptomyces sp. 3211]
MDRTATATASTAVTGATTTGAVTGTRTRTWRLVLVIASAALFVGAAATLTHGARTAPAKPHTTHASTAPAHADDGGSGHRLLSVLKHLWTTGG